MPTPPAPPVRVLTAERPGDSGVSQDRILVLPNAVAVLDGASGTADGDRDGGWYADQLVAALRPRLADDRSLTDILRDAIAEVAATHELVPGESPSSTVALVRWDADQLDALVLGDTAVVVFTDAPEPEVLEDRRLEAVATAERQEYRGHLAAGASFGPEHAERLRQLVAEERRHRNSLGGYWIAEADPSAADHALARSWPMTDVSAVLIATDGVAAGVNRYGQPPNWHAALDEVTQHGAFALVDLVHQAEAADPDGIRWPRSKGHDDKALAAVILGPS